MNIGDFLSENGFEEGALSPRSNDDMDTDSEAMMEPVEMPSKKVSLKRLADTEAGDLKRSKNDNSFLYAESKRARMEREKEEKKRRAQEIEFSAQDLALATVPGMEFDPRQRASPLMNCVHNQSSVNERSHSCPPIIKTIDIGKNERKITLQHDAVERLED